MDGGVFVYFFLDFCFIDEFFFDFNWNKVNKSMKQTN